MRALDVAALALNAALYAALGYIFFAILPLTTPGLGLVRFWPQVIIPAVFAVVFGPWVGGLGAAVGIFMSDMLIHGNPLLSIMAGVSSNFVCFFLIGYLAKRKIDWKIPLAGFGVASALLVWISFSLLPPDYAQYAHIVSAIIIGTYVILVVTVWLTPKWRSYEVGSMIGLLVGSAIIAAMVPLFSQFFILPGNTVLAPLTVVGGLVYLVWTFSTEIPFLIILGPPILEAVYRAFPAFKLKKEKGSDRGEDS
ncbi:hypothetical protein MUO79_01350 [Candidatus Bathyarchaeota archaeon]|nr:hypothetical protein [Candidatus Bathyarchaeota archaeon]